MNTKGFLAIAVCVAVAGVASADNGMGYSEPKSVTAVCGTSSAQVSWQAVNNEALSGYHVFEKRVGESAYERATSELLTVTQFTVHGLSTGVMYDFLVTAVYNSGAESAESSPAFCMVN